MALRMLYLDRLPVRPDVGAAAATSGANETSLDIGQPDIIRPLIGVEGDGMAAAIVRAIDQHAAHAGGTHLRKGDLLDGSRHAP